MKYKSHILDCRGELFGLSTLMIIFHHLANRGIPGLSSLPDFIAEPIKFFFAKGNLGVDIFIILSAIGLCYSMERNAITQFFGNRFKRVGVPWLVIMTPVFIVEDILLYNEGIIEVLLDASTLRYWIDNENRHTPWFVPFIVAIYLIFPLIYKLDVATKGISTYMLLGATIAFNVLCNIWPNYIYSVFVFCFARTPAFFLGILLSKHIKSGRAVSRKALFIMFALIGTLYVSWYFINVSEGADLMIGGIVAVGVMLFYSYAIKPIVCSGISKVLLFIGTVSLETYLVHTVILRVIDSVNIPNIWFALQYVLFPLASILLAKVASWISDKIMSISVSKKCKISQSPMD